MVWIKCLENSFKHVIIVCVAKRATRNVPNHNLDPSLDFCQTLQHMYCIKRIFWSVLWVACFIWSEFRHLLMYYLRFLLRNFSYFFTVNTYMQHFTASDTQKLACYRKRHIICHVFLCKNFLLSLLLMME